MAHYAKVIKGKVTTVIVAEPEFFNSFVETEPGEWVKTSYNMQGGVYIDPQTNSPASDQSIIDGDEARMRKNYAGINWNYDGIGFYPPQPYPSWTLNSSTYEWECPVSYPDDGKKYDWNEDNQSWDEVV